MLLRKGHPPTRSKPEWFPEGVSRWWKPSSHSVEVWKRGHLCLTSSGCGKSVTESLYPTWRQNNIPTMVAGHVEVEGPRTLHRPLTSKCTIWWEDWKTKGPLGPYKKLQSLCFKSEAMARTAAHTSIDNENQKRLATFAEDSENREGWLY